MMEISILLRATDDVLGRYNQELHLLKASKQFQAAAIAIDELAKSFNVIRYTKQI